ncbi:hypothetical protein [Actinoplanes derwentensis]|uniref:Predicted lipoprotein with conserved Yx(FWY)xxD motif n=1 Tax=Actinoplanes derwentensis TaxID=113562 RepID=A0A1H2B945_9ACTN|nr:hypothetical protein [Actinoplanes derwentensis]SDT54713.1 Predicted lipoprotein with conserved Yx(FWY)xxD motif [Actinoplanes derwentensis]
MTSTFVPRTSQAVVSGRARRAAGITLLTAVVALSAGCGKSITIGDAEPAQQPAAAPATTPAGTATEPAASPALQLVGNSAAEDGKTGDGGTVVGVEVQEEPPVWVQLSAVRAPDLKGPYLININQAALYRFDKDTAEPSRTNCVDACAVKWPPVTIKQKGKVYLAGVDPDEIGAIKREDGDVQLTVGGWPVYRFAEDEKPGDLNGEGVGGTWFAVGPKGEKANGDKG